MKTLEYRFLTYNIIKIFLRVICIDRNYLDFKILISQSINMLETKARGGSVGKPGDSESIKILDYEQYS